MQQTAFDPKSSPILGNKILSINHLDVRLVAIPQSAAQEILGVKNTLAGKQQGNYANLALPGSPSAGGACSCPLAALPILEEILTLDRDAKMAKPHPPMLLATPASPASWANATTFQCLTINFDDTCKNFYIFLLKLTCRMRSATGRPLPAVSKPSRVTALFLILHAVHERITWRLRTETHPHRRGPRRST